MLYSEEKLKSEGFLEEVRDLALDVISEDRFREAYDLSKDLEQSIDKIKGFKDKYINFYHEYKEIIVKLKWLGLPIMNEDKAANMFQNHYADIFKIPGYEVWPKLRIVLINILVIPERDKFKERVKQALLNNVQKLTNKKFVIELKLIRPTVGNWLLDYNKTLGTGRVNDLSRIEYITNGRNIKLLDNKEKGRVKNLFDFYERLKISSNTLEGVEEDIPSDEDNLLGTIRNGVFESFEETKKQKLIWQIVTGSAKLQSVKKNEPQINVQLDELKRMVAKYPAGSFERKAIEEEIRKMESLK